MELSNDLMIGEVCEVHGKVVTAGVYSDKNTEYLNYNGSIIKNVGIGSFVLIRKGFNNIIGKVDGEYTKELSTNEKSYAHMGTSIKRIISISILGGMQQEKFIHGLTDLPLIGNYVYILEEQVIAKIFSFSSNQQRIRLGKIIGHDDYPFEIGVQDIACSHVGIFGNTGSGKSNTLAKLYREMIDKYNSYPAFQKHSKFIVIDFNGEYESVFSKSDQYYLSTREYPKEDIDFANIYYRYPVSSKDILNPDFWAIILEATDKTQKPFVNRSLKKYRQIQDGAESFSIERLCELIIKTQSKYPELKYTIGDIFEAFGLREAFEELENHFHYNGQSKNFYTTNGSYSNYNISSNELQSTLFPSATLDVDKLVHMQPFRLFEFAIKYNYWLEISRSYITKEHIAPLVARANNRCDDMEKIFRVVNEREYASLLANQSNIEVISLLKVNIAMKKIVPMIICKIKYTEKKEQPKNAVLKSTLHFIIDEAHNILSDMSTRESEEWKDYRLESFEEIIKEGRKFGTFLTIASQRPSDISDTIISQLHNYFIHRLVNEEDLRKMHRTVAFADKASNEMIPILPAGGCLVSGLATNFPVLVQIDILPTNHRPKSENVDIDKVWTCK